MKEKETVKLLVQLFEDLYYSSKNAADVHLKGNLRAGARKIAKALTDLEKDEDVARILNQGDSER